MNCESCDRQLTDRQARYGRFCSSRCWGSALKFTPESFFARVDARGPDECWEWKGKRSASGYGMAGHRGIGAHRISYTLAKGPIPEGLVVRHRCDNKLCVNPSHLIAGTQKDNIADRDNRGRWTPARGEEHPSAKLRWDDVRAIRSAATGAPRGTVTRLAREYGLSVAGMRDVISGRNWREEPSS